MKVFKFGGASVSSAESVENVARILRMYPDQNLVVVVSAMGKTTNMLERLWQQWQSEQGIQEVMNQVEQYHSDIVKALFPNPRSAVYERLEVLFDEMREITSTGGSGDPDFDYDQIVCFGEVLSTVTIHEYLISCGMNAEWVDIRNVIRTDSKHREANVDWVRSAVGAEILAAHLDQDHVSILVTQGFIGGTRTGNATTLGREGSDFSAAIIAYLIDADSVTIWKDVPGMLNADPKWFANTVKLDTISYKEAIELAYYGASVIHPKTIKPLQNKGIPLYVKSFSDPRSAGTVISEDMNYDNLVPSYIFKPGQELLSISPRDFAFINEENLSEIFQLLSNLGISINLMQNSAINFSICVNLDSVQNDRLKAMLSKSYEVRFNSPVELLTIRHHDQSILKQIISGYEVLVEQRTRSTLRMVLRKI